jgi:hypothetical protein
MQEPIDVTDSHGHLAKEPIDAIGSLRLLTASTGVDWMRFGKKRIDRGRHVTSAVRPVKAAQTVADRKVTQGHQASSNEHGDKHNAEQLKRAGNRNLRQQHGFAFCFRQQEWTR